MYLHNLIKRSDGSKVKIIAELFGYPWEKQSILNYVLIQEKDDKNWKPCKKKSERNPIFEYATIGEILKVNNELMQCN